MSRVADAARLFQPPPVSSHHAQKRGEHATYTGRRELQPDDGYKIPCLATLPGP